MTDARTMFIERLNGILSENKTVNYLFGKTNLNDEWRRPRSLLFLPVKRVKYASTTRRTDTPRMYDFWVAPLFTIAKDVPAYAYFHILRVEYNHVPAKKGLAKDDQISVT